MSGHTPGPWEYSWQIQPNGCPTVGHKGLMVCMVAHSAKEPEQKETALANAALISTAPCLLKAAERYLQFMHHGNCGFGWQFSGVHPETELKNAIARAKGEK